MITRKDMHSYSPIVVRVDSYDDGIVTGQFWSVQNQNDRCTFSNMTQLILGIDSMIDDAAVNADNAMPSPYGLPMPQTIYRAGPFPRTLLIKIFFRQHSSWQGSVTDLKDGTVRNFKSVLEIMGILDSALDESYSAEFC